MADLPSQLQAAIDEAVDEGIAFPRLQELSDALRAGYRGEADATVPAIDSAENALAYATYRMPGTYAAVFHALERARSSIPGFEPTTIVDVGGGSGAATWAAQVVFPSLAAATVLDRSRAALDLGQHLAASGPAPIAQARWKSHRVGMEIPVVDLAVAGYLLGELAGYDRDRLLDQLAVAAPVVAIIEPGTTAGYGRIIDARSRLIRHGMQVAAPCPHDDECPLVGKDWCHFAARFARSPLLRRLKRADHPYEDEKFSYVVATRHPVERSAARVIRHPQKRERLVNLDLCVGDGRATQMAVPRSRGPEYRRARKTRWGDSWN